MYNTYGVTTHSEIAKKLQITTALAHKIEGDIFLKFAMGVFAPPWPVREHCLRILKDANGVTLRFDVGECAELLAERVRSVLCSGEDFRKKYEKRIVDISRNPNFRKFVIGILDPDSEEV